MHLRHDVGRVHLLQQQWPHLGHERAARDAAERLQGLRRLSELCARGGGDRQHRPVHLEEQNHVVCGVPRLPQKRLEQNGVWNHSRQDPALAGLANRHHAGGHQVARAASHSAEIHHWQDARGLHGPAAAPEGVAQAAFLARALLHWCRKSGSTRRSWSGKQWGLSADDGVLSVDACFQWDYSFWFFTQIAISLTRIPLT